MADVEIIECVGKLVESRAFPTSGNVFRATGQCHDGAMRDILDKLESFGIVEIVREQLGSSDWRFTRMGSRQITAMRKLQSPKPAVECRPASHQPLADLTQFELIVALVDEGWTWAKKPNKPKTRELQLAPYVLGHSDKVFYPSGLAQQPQHLQCLLMSEAILAQ
eukprot:6666012-Pyramimonas_sp.AAC.1